MDIATQIRLLFLLGLGVLVVVIGLIAALVQLTGGLAKPMTGALDTLDPRGHRAPGRAEEARLGHEIEIRQARWRLLC